MAKTLTQLRALGKYCAYGPEYDATAQDGLELSPARLLFIAFFFLAILPSLGWGLAASWGGAMVGVELYLRSVLKRQIVAGTRTIRLCRIIGSLAASAGWVGVAAACWVNPPAGG